MNIPWNKGKTKEDFPQLSNSGRKKGGISPNKGKKASNELIEKLSIAHLGQKSWNRGMKGYRYGMRRTPVGFKHTDETKEKMSLSHKGKLSWNYNGGLPNCKTCKKQLKSYKSKICITCYHADISKEEYKRRMLIALNKQQNMKEPTSIEKKVYKELKERGFLFETQKLINGKFLVDAYIPSLNMVIEVDGSYWHSMDRVVKKDKAENAYLTKCGFNLIRLSEEDVKNNNFIERIRIQN